MATRIHPSAVVEPGAQLGVDVEIGPFVYVGGEVVLGDRTRLHHHSSVEGWTTLGEGGEVFPYANLGAKTQVVRVSVSGPAMFFGSTSRSMPRRATGNSPCSATTTRCSRTAMSRMIAYSAITS
jgi:acyl-[acyl carrier protein]--UDP-N-acetylglucosamine O-acyltransferase